MTFIDADDCLFRLNSVHIQTKCKLIRHTIMSTNVTKKGEEKKMKRWDRYGMVHTFYGHAQTALQLLLLSVFCVPKFRIYFPDSIEKPHVYYVCRIQNSFFI